jgi:DNA-binding Lrp family transcriptional regulator
MFLFPPLSVEEQIVRILAARPQQTAKELHKKLAASRVSRSSFYEKLKRLREQGVVIKIGKRFSLHLEWSLDLIEFANNLNNNFVQSQSLLGLHQKTKQKQTWHFSEIGQLTSFWTHLILIFANKKENNFILDWSPSLWRYSPQHPSFTKALQQVRQAGGDVLIIFGEKSSPNTALLRNLDKEGALCSCAQSRYHSSLPLSYLNVMEDYIVTVNIDKAAHEKLESSELSQDDISKLKTRASLMLEYNPGKARIHQRKFEMYFGTRLNRRQPSDFEQQFAQPAMANYS